MTYYDGRQSNQELLAAAQARIEKLERMVVWMVDSTESVCINGDWESLDVDVEAPDDKKLAAVEKAMGEG